MLCCLILLSGCLYRYLLVFFVTFLNCSLLIYKCFLSCSRCLLSASTVPKFVASSRHDVTSYSPFYLLYGRDQLFPFDSLLPPDANSTAFYAPDVIVRVAMARRFARDRRHRNVSFSPGSLVLLWLPSRRASVCQKLLPRYVGSYRFLRQVTELTKSHH